MHAYMGVGELGLEFKAETATFAERKGSCCGRPVISNKDYGVGPSVYGTSPGSN